MNGVVESVPEALRREADAALAWLRAEHAGELRVTGVVDPARSLEDRERGEFELRLILCAQDACVRENLKLRHRGDGYEIRRSETPPSGDPPAELDPPPGVRQPWLAGTLRRHAFVVLLFYRGLW